MEYSVERKWNCARSYSTGVANKTGIRWTEKGFTRGDIKFLDPQVWSTLISGAGQKIVMINGYVRVQGFCACSFVVSLSCSCFQKCTLFFFGFYYWTFETWSGLFSASASSCVQLFRCKWMSVFSVLFRCKCQ